ncbi:methylosome subunit pICln isoform X2 [Carcharodon carcharias]|uniref:methylosome subunit pICln isoform X2 n=1 Tax=Carcharodon carcharias TaxID=13397 RepID=UPI001B7E6E9D|nr:methylosome subunit pICln isoform X2 [Carcharodon carcharias]
MVFLRCFPPPAEGVRLQQSEIAAVLDGKGLGTGTLYIAESRLSWFDGSGMGFSLEYPTISLHAVSRDATVYPQEHLYVMVNAKLGEECKETNMDEKAPGGEEEDDDDTDPITEVRFVPVDKTALEPMFTAMCDCQALHPDPDDTDSENDFEEDDEEGEEYDVEAHERGQGDVPTFYTYEEGFSHLNPEGQATLQRLEGMLAQSVNQQAFHMAGVRTESSAVDTEDGMEVDAAPVEAGQFDDADVDHW